MLAETPRVSVIMVNWNGAAHLRLCLPSLAAQSFRSLEVIVVDNGSSDDSAEVARSFGVRWLPLGVNLGLAPALNRGAAIAQGGLLLIVNNDMRFDPGFVASLAEPFENDQEIFATDAMQFNWDGSSCAHAALRLTNVPGKGESSTELVPGLHFYQQQTTKSTVVFMASAASMMARRTFFDQLGGFDGRLPLGYEDVEICWRAWLRGWKSLYVPDAICWHRLGGSSRSLPAARFNLRGVLRGRLLLATKLLPARYALRAFLVSTAGVAKDVSRRKWTFAWDRIRVLFSTAGLVMQLLTEKKSLFGKSSNSPKKMLEFFLRLTDDEVRD